MCSELGMLKMDQVGSAGHHLISLLFEGSLPSVCTGSSAILLSKEQGLHWGLEEPPLAEAIGLAFKPGSPVCLKNTLWWHGNNL